MKVFFLTLCVSLVLAGLACAQDPYPQNSRMLAAGPDSGGPGGPGGPPPAWNGQGNATRPQGKGHSQDGGQWQGRPNSGDRDGQDGGPGHGQIREALTKACSGRNSGDDCSVTGPGGNEISGRCAADRAGDALVCRPQHNPGQNREQGHPQFGDRDAQDQGQGRPKYDDRNDQNHGKQHGPGQNREALVAACSGKSAGDACGFSGPRGNELNGQCVQSRQGNELVCHPQRQ